MRFRLRFKLAWCTMAMAAMMAGLSGVAHAAEADMGYAVVPLTTIYPGETISAGQVEQVVVTNPNLAGDYARNISEVDGLVSKRTLLPGRTISISGLRVPFAMTRGSSVRLVFSMGSMTISAAGSPLADASVGDVIRARNLDSGVIVSGTVMDDGTIHVVAK